MSEYAPRPTSPYNPYAPSTRHDLHLDLYDQAELATSRSRLAPAPPPHSVSPQPADPFNPYPRTEDAQRPYQDYLTSDEASKDRYADPQQQFYPQSPTHSFQDGYAKQNDAYSPYVDPATNPVTPPPARPRTLVSRLFDGDQKYAWFCWTVSIVQIGVFIGELVRNAQAMGSPIEIQPTFNPLIGPSSYIMINMGARFPACMHTISGLDNITWPCLNNTSNPPSSGPQCSLSEICGFGGFHGKPPDQWFRVIVPIFLHGGILHILFNLLVQLRLGADMEKAIGTFRFVIVYFTAGIMGFILGANFAGDGIASTGCSGSLFGIIALVLLDLGYNWRSYEHPKRQLFILLIQCLVCFGLGLLPGLDNFSHLGGFATGLLLGIAVLRAPPRIRARLDDPRSSVYDLDAPYSSLTGQGSSSVGRKRGLLGYFKGRKTWWWIWNFIRLACLALVVVFMAVLLNNFYANGGGNCSWCKYLSCLPINGWCDLDNIKTTSTTSPNRKLF